MMKINLSRASLHVAVLSITTGLAASGCTLPNPKQIDYQSTERSKISTLEMPPDIVNTPDLKRSEVSSHVLAPVAGMHIERTNRIHWLVVEHKTPGQLWPRLRAFWRTQGFELAVDARARGILETDWKTSRARLNQGTIRNALSKVERLGNAYVTSEKNKYLTRVVANTDGRTWISIHHQGQHEVLTGITKETSQWQPAPGEPSLEVEYLQRLMVALADADAPKAELQPERSQAPALSAQSSEPVRINSEAPADTPAQLDLNAPFDQGWLQTGLALERANFTIAERNPMQGTYTLRYAGPAQPQPESGGFWHQIFQTRNKDKQAQRYMLKVQALDASTTRLFLVNEQGETDTSTRARHMLQLLARQLH